MSGSWFNSMVEKSNQAFFCETRNSQKDSFQHWQSTTVAFHLWVGQMPNRVLPLDWLSCLLPSWLNDGYDDETLKSKVTKRLVVDKTAWTCWVVKGRTVKSVSQVKGQSKSRRALAHLAPHSLWHCVTNLKAKDATECTDRYLYMYARFQVA